MLQPTLSHLPSGGLTVRFIFTYLVPTMPENVKKALTVGGAIVAIVFALSFIMRQAQAPTETVGNFASIPPKGAGAVEAGAGAAAPASVAPAPKGAGASEKTADR
jgi:hypothetical protein